MENDLVMMPIEQVKIAKDLDRNIENKKNILSKREVFWQHKLQTFIPHGLNKREG